MSVGGAEDRALDAGSRVGCQQGCQGGMAVGGAEGMGLQGKRRHADRGVTLKGTGSSSLVLSSSLTPPSTSGQRAPAQVFILSKYIRSHHCTMRNDRI